MVVFGQKAKFPDGVIVAVGTGLTSRGIALVVMLPHEFVRTQSYVPAIVAEYVEAFAPGIFTLLFLH